MAISDEMQIRIKVLKGNAEVLIKGVGKSLVGMKRAMNAATRAAGPLGLAIGAGGLVLAFKSVIRETSIFERELSKVATLTDDVNLIFGDYADTVEELSLQMGQATSTLSKGLFDIVSAGIPAAEAMNVLTSATELAVGGITSTGIATSAMITAFQTFEDQLKDTTDAADLLFAIQKKGRLTVEDVARTFGGVASTAKAAKLSVETLGTAFAAISRGGEGAETSIVQLRMIIEAFTKDVMPESAAAAKRLGFELNAQAIEGDGLLEVIKKLEKSSISERAVIFRQSRARRGLNNLLNQSKNLTDIYNGILNRSGENQKALNKQMETSAHQFERFHEALKKIQRIFGEALVDDMEEMARATADWMKTMEGVATINLFASAVKSLGVPVAFTAKMFAKVATSLALIRISTEHLRELEDEDTEEESVKGPLSLKAQQANQNRRANARLKLLEFNKEENILKRRAEFRARERRLNLETPPQRFQEDIDRMREASSDGFRAMNEEAKDFQFNTSSRFKDIEKDALNTFNIIDQTVKTLAQSMQRSMGDFFFKALKRDFDNMAGFFDGLFDQILRGLSNVASQQLVAGLASGAKGGHFGGFLQGIFSKNKLAKGDIVDSPTPGVFGDAGPEGVLPLRRDGSGNLGVIATGGGGSGETQITIVNTIAPAEMVKAGLTDPNVRGIIINEISGDILKRGTLFKTIRA